MKKANKKRPLLVWLICGTYIIYGSILFYQLIGHSLLSLHFFERTIKGIFSSPVLFTSFVATITNYVASIRMFQLKEDCLWWFLGGFALAFFTLITDVNVAKSVFDSGVGFLKVVAWIGVIYYAFLLKVEKILN